MGMISLINQVSPSGEVTQHLALGNISTKMVDLKTLKKLVKLLGSSKPVSISEIYDWQEQNHDWNGRVGSNHPKIRPYAYSLSMSPK